MYYNCYVFIIAGSPEFPPEHANQIMMVNVNNEMILNCTLSASPDPVYSWSFPDSCSSCPNATNKGVLIFTAEDVNDSGEYICVVENEYGNISITFDVSVVSKYLCEFMFTAQMLW